MKFFTNRSVIKKVIIVVLSIMLLTFAIPKPVNADIGGILLDPLFMLATAVLDSGQWLLESIMLGRPNYFMDKTLSSEEIDISPEEATITVNQKFTWGEVQVPDIQYTPEAIFANKVPALDVNFIKPSVTTGDEKYDNKHNIAIKLRPTIASWYIAMRTLAIVGLLSVLVYLGIRMLLTGVAADRAKYKKMLIDWLLAMCLLFILHYIMSFTLTMSEVITSMIEPGENTTVSVYIEDRGKAVNMTLMNYVRFMIECTDLKTKVGFLVLYIMLVIYSFIFTWTYLKRVIYMVFLTLIAPIITLTYPIDKASDGKAQAFELWIKEFVYNALLQPLHLLLYTVLLGTATELAIINPIYAIICLGFIYKGEKLFKSMFGFGKAGAGTVGTLAGALFASNLLNKAVGAVSNGKGGKNGVRTNDKYQREGKDKGTSNLNSTGIDISQTLGEQDIPQTAENSSPENNSEQELPLPDGSSTQQSRGEDAQQQSRYNENQISIDDQIAQEKANMSSQDYKEMNLSPEEWEAERRAELEEKRVQEAQDAQEEQKVPEPQGDSQRVREAMQNLGSEPQPEEPKIETWKDLLNADREKARQEKERKKQEREQRKLDRKDPEVQRRMALEKEEAKRKRNIERYKTWKGLKRTLPAIAMGAVKVGVGAGGSLLAGAASAAVTGDLEKSVGIAIAGGTGVSSLLGKVSKDKGIMEAYKVGKYGSAIEADNAKADEKFIKSDEFDRYYEAYFKEKKTRKEVEEAFLSYRQAGIQDKKVIKEALKLEDAYVKNNADRTAARHDIQNVLQRKDQFSVKAIKGDQVSKHADISMVEQELADNISDPILRRRRAEALFKVRQDIFNTGIG